MGDEEYYDIELSLGGLTKDEVRALIVEVTTMPNLLRNIHVNRTKAFETTVDYR